MDNKRLGKALDIMRLAEEAAARSGGISLVQIVETFGVNLRTAQRMSRALEVAFPTVQTYTDKERRKWWQLSDHRLLHMQGIRDSELSAWLNAWNSARTSWLDRPMPVSCTLMRSCTLSSCSSSIIARAIAGGV